MARWRASLYIGIRGKDQPPDPTITYLTAEEFEAAIKGAVLPGRRRISVVVEQPFGKPWHKLLFTEPIK